MAFDDARLAANVKGCPNVPQKICGANCNTASRLETWLGDVSQLVYSDDASWIIVCAAAWIQRS
jgi:hypothetical protein